MAKTEKRANGQLTVSDRLTVSPGFPRLLPSYLVPPSCRGQLAESNRSCTQARPTLSHPVLPAFTGFPQTGNGQLTVPDRFHPQAIKTARMNGFPAYC